MRRCDDTTSGGGKHGGSKDSGAADASDAGVHELDIAVCDPDAKGFTLGIDNPYFPLGVGQVATFKGEEDGGQDEVIISVLDEIETVAGVDTRVIEERESQDGELVEVSHNYFVQAADGTVCYFGEDSDSRRCARSRGGDGHRRVGTDPPIELTKFEPQPASGLLCAGPRSPL